MAEAKESKNGWERFEPLLSYLSENQAKLKILLSGEQKAYPLLYPVKGKRTTKTVFIAEKLQFLINEYCIENDLKIGDVVECAIIQHLNQNGYDEKLKFILNMTEVENP